MSINNSRDYIAYLETLFGGIVTDHLVAGRNIQLVSGTYTQPDLPDFPNFDTVTFEGTARSDTLFGGGGEYAAFFLGTAGDDLYGAFIETGGLGFVDYSGAKGGVRVDLSYTGSRTFTDADGEVRTVDIHGKARDGFGGTDYFADSSVYPGSGVYGFFGSSHRDVMIEDPETEWGHEFYGGAGNDLLIGAVVQYGGDGNDRLVNYWEGYGEAGNDVLIGGWSHFGGAGDDRLVGRLAEDGYYADGGEGNDCLLGTGFIDWLIGGAGNDRIFAKGGDDPVVVGEAGNDYVDGGAGNDFIDGGVGRDVLVSGSGNDTINPDVEFFQVDPDRPTDGARDVVRVTRADLGDYTDVVLSRAFEAGLDEVRFAAALGGERFRVFQEAQSFGDDGALLRDDDLAGRVNTVLQIDADADGLGSRAARDADDYFLVVVDADLSLNRAEWLLT
ncbi:calcium-binding protein [Amaricoccus sp.]|uniref:calcium-binding protein n=1 Tax=Amaricoccus sp. TaxID=1872485 RepID=UPI001B5BE042|nr:calcium-binding protein [Amaricoccus sp.]MBP7000435.1 hypothetical protein [Amaricoccus sp.]